MSFHERETEEIQHPFLSDYSASPVNQLESQNLSRSENSSDRFGESASPANLSQRSPNVGEAPQKPKLTVGSLFAGIGGFDLGLERTGGFEVRWQVEIDEYCRRVLEKHWPHVKRYGDIREVHDVERVDVLCGGFPCQDISNAGKRAGIDGERSGLWSEYERFIRMVRPRVVIVENVAALLYRRRNASVLVEVSS